MGLAGSRVPSLLVTALGGAVYFTGTDAAHSRKLWRNDGTVAGTATVVDLAPGLADGAPQKVAVWGGRLSSPDDGLHGSELWSIDGTAGGTPLALDLAPGPAGSPGRPG